MTATGVRANLLRGRVPIGPLRGDLRALTPSGNPACGPFAELGVLDLGLVENLQRLPCGHTPDHNSARASCRGCAHTRGRERAPELPFGVPTARISTSVVREMMLGVDQVSSVERVSTRASGLGRRAVSSSWSKVADRDRPRRSTRPFASACIFWAIAKSAAAAAAFVRGAACRARRRRRGVQRRLGAGPSADQRHLPGPALSGPLRSVAGVPVPRPRRVHRRACYSIPPRRAAQSGTSTTPTAPRCLHSLPLLPSPAANSKEVSSPTRR